MTQKLYTIGKMVNTHGIRGEVKVLSQTHFPEDRFVKGNKLLLTNPEQNVSITVEIEEVRAHKNNYLLKFKNYNNINEVEKYKGWSLKITEDDLFDLPEGEYYYHEIIGCKVVTEDGKEIGEITEILSPGANDVWVVQPPKGMKGKTAYIPVIDDVVLNVDIEQKKVLIHVLEGLLDV